MNGLQIFILLMAASILLVGAAQKLRIPYPLALVLGGSVMGFIPGVNQISIDPQFLLPVVLPPALYYGAFWISFREFKQNWVEIFSLALGLVFATTLVIGLLFKWLFPDFPWALAFAFGAIVSPPDALAALTILKRFNISTRLMNVLEGESLINDASGLVLYRIALTALLSGIFSWADASVEFVKIAVGGVAVGLGLGYLLQSFSRRYLNPVVGIVFSFIIPYLTYLLADWLGFSGVLAVVVVGLIGSRFVVTVHSSLRRVVGYATWDIFMIFLNCFVFVLIGSELRKIAGEMSWQQILVYTWYGLLITLAMIAVRMSWVYIEKSIPYFHAKINPKLSPRCPLILRDAAILGWSGMRGIVSLAAALALPLYYPSGELLQGRDVAIFLTFVVIFLTLMIPGLTLSGLISWLKIHHHNQEASVLRNARKKLSKIAENEILKFFNQGKISEEDKNFLLNYFRARHRIMEISHAEEHDLQNLELVRIEIVHALRTALIKMWENYELEDGPFSHLERELDLEEEHLARAIIE